MGHVATNKAGTSKSGAKQVKRIGILLGFVIAAVVVRCVIPNSREW